MIHEFTLWALVLKKVCIIFSAIAIARDSSFKKDQEILVLPLDSLKFDTHEKLTQDVLKHFGKVGNFFLINFRVLDCLARKIIWLRLH